MALPPGMMRALRHGWLWREIVGLVASYHDKLIFFALY
jgi:hypothetical protein